jgi:hypothetical protein
LFKDFISKDVKVVIPERHAVYHNPSHTFQIAHPYLMMDWLRAGQIPDLSSTLDESIGHG